MKKDMKKGKEKNKKKHLGKGKNFLNIYIKKKQKKIVEEKY